MVFYRRNTFSDKMISFLCFMMMFITTYTIYTNYQLTGIILLPDVLLVLGSFGMGVLFLSTFRFKYLEITQDKVTWYTWFIVKHTLKKEQIKEVGTRKRSIILVKQKGEVWLSNTLIRDSDDQKVRELLKTFNK